MPLIWRRQWPMAVVRPLVLPPRAFGIAELPDPPVQVAILVALFTVAMLRAEEAHDRRGADRGGRSRRSIFMAGDSGPDDYYTFFLPAALAIVVGDRQRTRAAYLAAVEGRARSLELDQRAAAERAVEAERARIARELHDVVAHHVSMIVVQAEAGAASATTAGAERFDAIATTGRVAMLELRRLLGVLRDSDQAPTPPCNRVWTRSRCSSPAGPGRGRPGDVATHRGRASPVAGRCRCLGLSDRAGGADQRRPSRRFRADPGTAALQRGRHPRDTNKAPISDTNKASISNSNTP